VWEEEEEDEDEDEEEDEGQRKAIGVSERGRKEIEKMIYNPSR